MPLYDKKQKEKLILELVYDTSLFQSVISTEEPDFELRYKDHLTAFGVEITELYSSESMARIRNIPGYVSSMISGEYKHKDDMSALPAKEFTVIKEGNTHHKKIKGLIQEKVGIEDYRKKIEECIESKNRRFDSYIENLSHVNLVIFDFEDYMLGKPSDKIHSILFNQSLERILLESDFNEIFLVTKIGSYESPQQVYIPLKMLFLVAEAYRFNHFMVKNYKQKATELEAKEAILFAEYLKWRGVKKVFCTQEDTGCEVVYGDAGVFLDGGNKLTIRMHSDIPLGDDYKEINNQEARKFFDKEFEQKFEEDYKTSVFTSELYYPVIT